MSKKFTVYLSDDEAKRLESETSRQASPGKVIQQRLQHSWHEEGIKQALPKVVKTDAIFTRGGDEIKRHVSDNDVSMWSDGIVKQAPSAPVSFCDPGHVQVLLTITEKKGSDFQRAEIVRSSKVSGDIVDEVIRALMADGSIKKVDYNTYRWTRIDADSADADNQNLSFCPAPETTTPDN
jgi:hypothetical protein